MKRLIRWAGTTLKYLAGMALWFLIFTVLQFACIFNIRSFVDALWMKELHDGLVQNVIGEVAYRARNGYGDYGCGDEFIYFSRYHPTGEYTAGELRSLSSMVDVPTWRKVKDSTATLKSTVTFRDLKHEYELRYTSDGTSISAEDR